VACGHRIGHRLRSGAVTFLASDYAAWITGVVLLVDGGSALRGLPDYVDYLLPQSN
jgi:enoyl-[acyl-carrier-protein] reductase (NADH)